jgi:hypothetical protein
MSCLTRLGFAGKPFGFLAFEVVKLPGRKHKNQQENAEFDPDAQAHLQSVMRVRSARRLGLHFITDTNR